MDHNRRTFLKLILIGGGTFIAGRVFGPFFSKYLNDSIGVTKTQPKSDFNIVENSQFLTIYDNTGHEVFQIDKTGDAS